LTTFRIPQYTHAPNAVVLLAGEVGSPDGALGCDCGREASLEVVAEAPLHEAAGVSSGKDGASSLQFLQDFLGMVKYNQRCLLQQV